MAANATLTVNVVADTTSATKGLDKTTDAMDRMGREAKTASDRVDDVGGKAGSTTSGLRDMADAVGMIGFPGLAEGMGVAAVGFEAIDGATTLWTTHSALLTKALGKVNGVLKLLKLTILTNPIFIIAAVLIAIVAVFVLLYIKCETFRKIVNKVFTFVWNLIKGFWNWLKTAFAALFDILAKPFEAYMGFLRGIVGKIKSIFAGVFDAIKKPFEKAINWVKDHFKLPKLPSWLPGIGKSAPGTAGVFVPSPRAGGSVGGHSGATVVINFNGPVGDPHAVSRQLRRMFRDDEARLGRLRPSPVGS